MAAVNASAKPLRSEPPQSWEPASRPDVVSGVAALRGRLADLEAAMFAEGIDPAGPLGVWCRAQKDVLTVLAVVAEEQSDRILERAAVVEQSMNAAVERVDAEVGRVKVRTEEARQLMLTMRADTADSKEARLKVTDDMAVHLSDKIQECLETTMLVRERRWNLRQNLGLVAVGFGLLFSAFLAGEWTQGHNMGQDIIRRCGMHLAVDPGTKIAYCAMSTVEGLPEPTASAR